MPYTQTVFDNFNDASINTSIWTINVGTGLSESGGTLNLACVSNYPEIEQTTGPYDVEDGILGVKVSKSGTATPQSEIYMSIHDDTGRFIGIWLGAEGAAEFQTYGSVTVSSLVYTDTTGFGSGWVNGTWFGIGNMSTTDDILRFYKSSDGQNWTEMYRCTWTGGSFTRSTCGMLFNAGTWSGTSTLVWNLDDASWFLRTESGSTQYTKVRVGDSWINAKPKVRLGDAWVNTHPKVRLSDSWNNTY